MVRENVTLRFGIECARSGKHDGGVQVANDARHRGCSVDARLRTCNQTYNSTPNRGVLQVISAEPIRQRGPSTQLNRKSNEI